MLISLTEKIVHIADAFLTTGQLSEVRVDCPNVEDKTMCHSGL